MHSVVRRSAVLVLAVGLVAGPVSGCASDPDPSPPAGVDELTVPTSSLDPGDVVDGIDNPWLSWTPGESTTLSGSSGSITLVVAPTATETPGGVPGWVVTTRSVEGEQVDTYAQDDEGNVWLVARAGAVEAGQDGAGAGLLMAATPRLGDGYYTAYRPGVVEERAEVTALEDGTVEITTTDAQRPGIETVATYEKGTGLIRLETGSGVFER